MGILWAFWFLLMMFFVTCVNAGAIPGQEIYDKKCKSCHGKTGEGNPVMGKALKIDPALLPLKDLKKTDEELTVIIRDGKNKMPAFKGKVPDDEISHIVQYIRSFSKK
ncbi:MAG: cytochrome c [Chlamydiae bacterium]|nr:cytochrome c [Chlamydiota bacterium]MBI3276982.1 cytochrome c [Chlamydiota bacterium]